jgi:hypothetical protein
MPYYPRIRPGLSLADTGASAPRREKPLWFLPDSHPADAPATLAGCAAEDVPPSSGKEVALLPLPPLRTGRDSFPSSGSSRW